VSVWAARAHAQRSYCRRLRANFELLVERVGTSDGNDGRCYTHFQWIAGEGNLFTLKLLGQQRGVCASTKTINAYIQTHLRRWSNIYLCQVRWMGCVTQGEAKRGSARVLEVVGRMNFFLDQIDTDLQ